MIEFAETIYRFIFIVGTVCGLGLGMVGFVGFANSQNEMVRQKGTVLIVTGVLSAFPLVVNLLFGAIGGESNPEGIIASYPLVRLLIHLVAIVGMAAGCWKMLEFCAVKKSSSNDDDN